MEGLGAIGFVEHHGNGSNTIDIEIRNPKHEARNKSEILLRSPHPAGGAPVSNFQMFKTNLLKY
jgi:hypothetical protein